MPDYYEILGVSRQASVHEIRKAYALLAKAKHPDRFTDPVEKERAQESFKEITTAFNALSNDKSRKEYDDSLARPRLTTPEEQGRDAYQRGLQRLEERDRDGAAALFRAAAAYQPGEARYHAALARALARDPRGAREAIQSLERAVQLAPDNAAFHAQLAALFLGQGLGMRARREAESALLLAPTDPEVRRIASEAGAAPPGEEKEGGGLLDRFRRKP